MLHHIGDTSLLYYIINNHLLYYLNQINTKETLMEKQKSYFHNLDKHASVNF